MFFVDIPPLQSFSPSEGARHLCDAAKLSHEPGVTADTPVTTQR
jgi:hypothetical protein